MAEADQGIKNNATRRGSVPWQRPRRVSPSRHILSTDVALSFVRVALEFCMSECSTTYLIGILHLSCPHEVFIWSVELNDSTLYIGISANATCPCPRESFSARKVDVTKEIGHRHTTTGSSCIVCLGTTPSTPTSTQERPIQDPA